MTDRYDDSDRGGNQGRFDERREGREHEHRGEFNRDDPYNRGRNRGNYEGGQERYGQGDFGRQERQGQGDYGRERYNEQSNFENQRGGRDYEQRGPDWQRNRTEWGRERTGNEGPWGTGSQGFSTGYRSGEYSSGTSGFGGSGGYTGYGSSGSMSYSGGAGTYGQQQGRHSGKGPKGYQRNDERIREDVCERLTQHPEIDASEIEVKVSNGEVTLTGTVEERHAKRMAEDVAENVSGAKDVHNQIRVREREMAGMQQSGRTETGSKEKTGRENR